MSCIEQRASYTDTKQQSDPILKQVYTREQEGLLFVEVSDRSDLGLTHPKQSKKDVDDDDTFLYLTNPHKVIKCRFLPYSVSSKNTDLRLQARYDPPVPPLAF